MNTIDNDDVHRAILFLIQIAAKRFPKKKKNRVIDKLGEIYLEFEKRNSELYKLLEEMRK